MLASREHSRRELLKKLLARGHDPAACESLLDDLSRQGLLSDARYAESYIHSRAGRGFGPLRIRAELEDKGVADDQAAECLEAADIDWTELAKSAHDKKFTADPPDDPKERARRIRFLEYRGFSRDQIRKVIWPDDCADG